MQTFFLKQNDTRSLTLFLLGWGMDERPVLPVAGKENVLFVYNYVSPELDFDFSPWTDIRLLAFSCGVFMAPYLAERLPEVRWAAAVNGVPDLFDEQKGMPARTVDTFRRIGPDNYLAFRRGYLVETEDEFRRFNENQPLRTVEDSMAELEALEKYAQNPAPHAFRFDRVCAARGDQVIPLENQKRSWGKVEEIEGNHFVFYRYPPAFFLHPVNGKQNA